MASSPASDSIKWFRYPFGAAHELAKVWFPTETLPGCAPNSLDAFARGCKDFLGFCQRGAIEAHPHFS